MEMAAPAEPLPIADTPAYQVDVAQDWRERAEMLPGFSDTMAAKGMEEAGEIGCMSCESRRYIDDSDSSTVTFQSPSKIDPQTSIYQVASHEREHISEEQAKADAKGAKVLSHQIQIQYDVCPECGSLFAAGGCARTTTATPAQAQESYQAMQGATEAPRPETRAAQVQSAGEDAANSNIKK